MLTFIVGGEERDGGKEFRYLFFLSPFLRRVSRFELRLVALRETDCVRDIFY